jgi:long-chain acyl-CoA synthetase
MASLPNLPSHLRRHAERLGDRPAIRFRSHGLYHDLSWRVLAERVSAVAASLLEAGVEPGERVGILSENRPAWLIADLAILSAGAVTMPMHAPLSARQVGYQLADSDAVWLFVSNREQAAKVAEVRGELPRLRGVVAMDVGQAFLPANGSTGKNSISWTGFEQRGRLRRSQRQAELDRRLAALGPDDLATILYTSGTTGEPKGVMLTHGNLVANAQMMIDVFGPFDGRTLFFNWLPLSHIYARTVDYYVPLLAGITIALAESPDTVVADLIETRPTQVSSVPRFYEKLVGSVAGLPAEDRRRRLRGIFGPNIHWLGSGGAPLPIAVAKVFEEVGLDILQGYGLTETSPVITINRKGANRIGTVGPALPGVDVRIAADGEILTRGPHIMKGYWKHPEATANAIQGGWFHTGDLGQLDADGYLTITGRKKDLIVLSNGKKVAPTFVEGLLAAEPMIEQAVVFGEGKPYLTALIVPRWPVLREALRARGIDGSDEELSMREDVQQFLRERIEPKLNGAADWERVGKIVIVPKPFSVVNGEMTVSSKLRREMIFQHHRDELEELYRSPPSFERP